MWRCVVYAWVHMNYIYVDGLVSHCAYSLNTIIINARPPSDSVFWSTIYHARIHTSPQNLLYIASFSISDVFDHWKAGNHAILTALPSITSPIHNLSTYLCIPTYVPVYTCTVLYNFWFIIYSDNVKAINKYYYHMALSWHDWSWKALHSARHIILKTSYRFED